MICIIVMVIEIIKSEIKSIENESSTKVKPLDAFLTVESYNLTTVPNVTGTLPPGHSSKHVCENLYTWFACRSVPRYLLLEVAESRYPQPHLLQSYYLIYIAVANKLVPP